VICCAAGESSGKNWRVAHHHPANREKTKWFRWVSRSDGAAEVVQLPRTERRLRFRVGSFDFFIRIDAPQIRLLDKAIEAIARHTAPGAVAAAHACDHVWLQLRDRRRFRARLAVENRIYSFLPGRNQSRAPARKKRMEHPPLRTFGIADLTPNFKFGGDLDGKARALKNPDGPMVLGRAFAQVHAIGLQAHITRNR